MIKLVVTFRKRTDLTREEFEHYWRNVHGPLAVRHAEALRIVRYSQSPNLHSEPIDQLVSQRGWSGHADGQTEIYWESEEEMTMAFASAAGQAASAELAADEARFCDMSSVVAFLAAEDVVLDRTRRTAG